MPFVLKPATPTSKGVVVFTHKELPFLEDSGRALVKARERLRERYVVGVHWGHFHDDVGEIKAVDFHLAGPGTVRFRAGTAVRRIPLCSRNFTAACFRR